MKDNIIFGLIVISICTFILFVVHHILDVPETINSLNPSSVLGMLMKFEGLALFAIFTGVFLDHIKHMISWWPESIRKGEEIHAFTLREFLLGVGTVSTSAGIFYFLQSVSQ